MVGDERTFDVSRNCSYGPMSSFLRRDEIFGSAPELLDFVLNFLGGAPPRYRHYDLLVRAGKSGENHPRAEWLFRPGMDPERVDEACGLLWSKADPPDDPLPFIPAASVRERQKDLRLIADYEERERAKAK